MGTGPESAALRLPSAGLPQPVVMEALDQAEGLTDSQREMPPPPPPSPPSEPAQKPPPQGTWSHSLTVKSSLCLLAASQFLVRTLQASPGPGESAGGGVALPKLAPWGYKELRAFLVSLSDFQPSGWHEEKAGVLSYSLNS